MDHATQNRRMDCHRLRCRGGLLCLFALGWRQEARGPRTDTEDIDAGSPWLLARRAISAPAAMGSERGPGLQGPARGIRAGAGLRQPRSVVRRCRHRRGVHKRPRRRSEKKHRQDDRRLQLDQNGRPQAHREARRAPVARRRARGVATALQGLHWHERSRGILRAAREGRSERL